MEWVIRDSLLCLSNVTRLLLKEITLANALHLHAVAKFTSTHFSISAHELSWKLTGLDSRRSRCIHWNFVSAMTSLQKQRRGSDWIRAAPTSLNVIGQYHHTRNGTDFLPYNRLNPVESLINLAHLTKKNELTLPKYNKVSFSLWVIVPRIADLMLSLTINFTGNDSRIKSQNFVHVDESISLKMYNLGGFRRKFSAPDLFSSISSPELV